MSERELTRRFADAVADEPPLDVDALVAAATGPARPRRDRRTWTVLASAAATAAFTVAIGAGVLVMDGDDGGTPTAPTPTTVPASPTSTTTPTATTTSGPPRVVDLDAAAAAMSIVGPEVVRDHGVELLAGAPLRPWEPYSDRHRQDVSGGYRLAAVPVGADTSTLFAPPSIGLTVQYTGSTLDPSTPTRPWLPPETYPPTETTLPDGSLLRVYEGYDIGSGTRYLNVAAAVHLRTDGIVVHAMTSLVGLRESPRPAFLVDFDTLVALATDPRLTM